MLKESHEVAKPDPPLSIDWAVTFFRHSLSSPSFYLRQRFAHPFDLCGTNHVRVL
jgi:hypothetical protein